MLLSHYCRIPYLFAGLIGLRFIWTRNVDLVYCAPGPVFLFAPGTRAVFLCCFIARPVFLCSWACVTVFLGLCSCVPLFLLPSGCVPVFLLVCSLPCAALLCCSGSAHLFMGLLHCTMSSLPRISRFPLLLPVLHDVHLSSFLHFTSLFPLSHRSC